MAKANEYFSLAFGNLKHRGLRSWLTMLGIFIGIAAVVSLISLGQGLQAAVMGQFGSLSIDKLTIQNKGTGFGPPGSTVVVKLNDHDVDVIKKVGGIEEILTRLIRVVRVEYNGVATYNYVADVPDSQTLINFMYESTNVKIGDGRLLRAGDRGKIIVGADIAKSEQYGKNIRVGSKLIINGKNFEVVGILKKSSSFQINAVILINTKDLEDILNIKNEYDVIVAQVADKNKIEDIAKNIEDSLRRDRNEKAGQEDFSVQTPEQALSSVNTILSIINLIVAGIAAISLIVGAVGIANTMYTSVVERTKEIGVMKAIGARNSDIAWIFLIEAGLLGLVGGVVGALMGLSLAFVISYGANSFLGENLFTVSISYFLLFGSIAFSFGIGVASGVFPALQASRLKIVDALRGGLN